MLKYHTFICNMVQVNTYLIWDETKLACIIDPGFSNAQEEKMLLDFLEQNELQLSRCIATHLHFDHVLGGRFITEHFGIPVETSRKEMQELPSIETQMIAFGVPTNGSNYSFETRELEGPIRIGNTQFEALETPGHSPGHITLYNKEAAAIFCGDVLFKGSYGRYDLWGASHKDLIDSISTLLRLPNDTIVLPGHGPSTTIGAERQHYTGDIC